MVFIPAYKAENTVCSVIDRIPKDVLKRCTKIVVSDNSSPVDPTKMLQDYRKKKKLAKLIVVRQKKNRLYGGNEKFGCDYAVKHGMDIIVILHADGQYPPEEIANLIRPIEEGKANLVAGSRFLGNPLKGGMPKWRYLGNILLTRYENLTTGHKMSEWHSGFRAYDCKILREIPFRKCVDGYEWTTDLLLLFIINHSRISEVSIPTHYGEESTSPSLKRTFLYFIFSCQIATLFFLDRIGIMRIEKYHFKGGRR
jgi:glycosyltransferase involved in cell wall biosynthesis